LPIAAGLGRQLDAVSKILNRRFVTVKIRQQGLAHSGVQE
jgi:hypothetical protein